jgi:hypothetical protein
MVLPLGRVQCRLLNMVWRVYYHPYFEVSRWSKSYHSYKEGDFGNFSLLFFSLFLTYSLDSLFHIPIFCASFHWTHCNFNENISIFRDMGFSSSHRFRIVVVRFELNFYFHCRFIYLFIYNQGMRHLSNNLPLLSLLLACRKICGR